MIHWDIVHGDEGDSNLILALEDVYFNVVNPMSQSPSYEKQNDRLKHIIASLRAYPIPETSLVGGFKHFLFSITYMGCHPSHWRTHIFQDGYCNHQPDQFGMVYEIGSTENPTWPWTIPLQINGSWVRKIIEVNGGFVSASHGADCWMVGHGPSRKSNHRRLDSARLKNKKMTGFTLQ